MSTKKVKPEPQSVNADEKLSSRRPLDDNALQIIRDINEQKGYVKEFYGDNPLSAADRRRLISSGIRNYGFLDVVYDISETNKQYAPGTFSRLKLGRKIESIEALRNIKIATLQLLDVIDDALINNGHDAFTLALIYYNTVRDLARHGDKGAKEVFDMLKPYFKRQKRKKDEPTDQEVERDVRALLHGTKEGEVIVKNEGDKIIKGKKEVIDTTHKAKGEWKETESGEIEE